MSNTKIQVKLRETGALITTDERIAYRLFAQDIADINPNANILGATDGNEESEIRMTIRALVEMKLRTPHGKAFAYADRQSPLDLELLNLFEEMYAEYADNMPRISVESFFAWLKQKHPEVPYKFTTVDRSLRRSRQFDKINSDGSANYWSKKRIEVAHGSMH